MDGELNTRWVTDHNTASEDKGIVLTFNEAVEIHEIHVWPRGDCCSDRYGNICLYADDQKIACSPGDYKLAPKIAGQFLQPINFIEEFVKQKEITARGTVFKLMFEDQKSLGISDFVLTYKYVKGW